MPKLSQPLVPWHDPPAHTLPGEQASPQPPQCWGFDCVLTHAPAQYV
jgi:hypothetical protein